MRENITQNIEDYLKTIYILTSEGKRASTNDIADALGVTPASVTGMIKKLSTTNPPLVLYQKHRGVFLSPPGELIALEILRHHRLLEMYLHQVLGYELDQVHSEADRLEHVISERFEERIAEALGNPSHDPHGDPIPTRDLQMPESPSQILADLRPGQSAVVHRVSSKDENLLRYLSDLGLLPQTKFDVIAYSPIDFNLTIQISGKKKSLILGYPITSRIYVEVTES
jgi:DtxR family Mn-dependent transcriptional regulator